MVCVCVTFIRVGLKEQLQNKDRDFVGFCDKSPGNHIIAGCPHFHMGSSENMVLKNVKVLSLKCIEIS